MCPHTMRFLFLLQETKLNIKHISFGNLFPATEIDPFATADGQFQSLATNFCSFCGRLQYSDNYSQVLLRLRNQAYSIITRDASTKLGVGTGGIVSLARRFCPSLSAQKLYNESMLLPRNFKNRLFDSKQPESADILVAIL